MNKNGLINKQTYYQIPMELKMIINAYGFNTSKYKLNKRDLKNNYYVSIEFLGIAFKIPFKALFHTNDKIKGIKGLDFNNAAYCTSFRDNRCQIPCKKYCYAYVFELQYLSSIDSKKGFMTFNSYYKGFLLVRAFNVIYKDKNTYNKFLEYIDKYIPILRFNVNSEFNNALDVNLIYDIALICSNTIIYGYSARDDLLKGYKPFNYSRLFINGSNEMYDNKYNVTFSLKEYFMAINKCLGSCNACKKCFKLKNELITTLFHNSRADSILNTLDNRNFIVRLVNALDGSLELKESDLRVNKGIFFSLNKFLISKGCNDLKSLDITNIKGFLDYIYYMPRIELKALINDSKNVNKDVLKEYGLL